MNTEDKTLAQTYRDTIAAIDKHGWDQGELYTLNNEDVEGGLCLVGGITVARKGFDWLINTLNGCGWESGSWSSDTERHVLGEIEGSSNAFGFLMNVISELYPNSLIPTSVWTVPQNIAHFNDNMLFILKEESMTKEQMTEVVIEVLEKAAIKAEELDL